VRCNVRASTSAFASDSSARRLARSSSRSYSRRSVASKTAVRMTRGVPSAARSRTEFTSTGSREPSAHTISNAISRTLPRIRSSGA
jgi:hypothetical protein